MVAMAAATMDLAEAAGAVLAEMTARVAMPGMAAILVPKGAAVAPIAVNKWAVIAVIIAVVIVRARTRDAYADADRPDMDSGADLGIRGCGANQGQRKRRSEEFLLGVFLV